MTIRACARSVSRCAATTHEEHDMQSGLAQGHAGTRRTVLLILLTATVAAVIAALSTVAALAASDRFGDVATGHPHEPGIEFMADSGVSIGCGDGSNYCPDEAVTRAQMGTFMHRLSGNADGTDPSVDAATLQGMTPEDLMAGTDGDGGETGEVDESRLEAIEDRLDALEAENAALQSLLADVTRGDVDGTDTLTFSGVNLQIVNGEGETDTVNGLGNLIVGYNGQTVVGADPDRSGSHSVVVGDGHGWTSHGALIAGRDNTVSGAWASVLGGSSGTASGDRAAVVGGRQNTAGGTGAVVTGGQGNQASGNEATVLGGQGNEAAGVFANSIAGGRDNEIFGAARWASILGGNDEEQTSDFGMHPN
jgi:hypothetical protein